MLSLKELEDITKRDRRTITKQLKKLEKLHNVKIIHRLSDHEKSKIWADTATLEQLHYLPPSPNKIMKDLGRLKTKVEDIDERVTYLEGKRKQ